MISTARMNLSGQRRSSGEGRELGSVTDDRLDPRQAARPQLEHHEGVGGTVLVAQAQLVAATEAEAWIVRRMSQQDDIINAHLATGGQPRFDESRADTLAL